jgi:hypothetical protein
VAPAIFCFMKFVTNATVAKQFDAGQPAEDTVSVSSDDVQLWVCARAFRTSVATHARSHSMTVRCCIAHDRRRRHKQRSPS